MRDDVALIPFSNARASLCCRPVEEVSCTAGACRTGYLTSKPFRRRIAPEGRAFAAILLSGASCQVALYLTSRPSVANHVF